MSLLSFCLIESLVSILMIRLLFLTRFDDDVQDVLLGKVDELIECAPQVLIVSDVIDV